MGDSAKLMVPLFVDGNFNRQGKRIRARYIKTLWFEGIDYPLWVSAGRNENDYPRAENDTHYLMIQANDYLVPCGYTEYNLEVRSGDARLVSEWYGSNDARDEFYSRIRNGRSYEESDPLIKAQIVKENETILVYGKDESIQAEYLKKSFIDPAIASYIDARDNGGKFANFQGAAFLGEVERCYEISKTIKSERKKAEAIKRAEQAEREKREAEARAAAEQAELQEAENVFINGGTIEDARVVVRIADRLGINIPIRTKGWMLSTMVDCTISNDGSASYRYYLRKKSAKGSQKVYDILREIRNSLLNLKIA